MTTNAPPIFTAVESQTSTVENSSLVKKDAFREQHIYPERFSSIF